MGGGSSRYGQPSVPIPQYPLQGGSQPQFGGISRPGTPFNSGIGNSPYNAGIGNFPYNAGMGGTPPLNVKQQRQLMQAQQTIADLQGQLSMQRGGGIGAPSPYGGPPIMNSSQGGPPMLGQSSSYPPPNALLQQLAGHPPTFYQQASGPGGFRDVDFAAVANISGLNPADIALLHREYINLTHGGVNKIDRVVFRHLLRDVLVESNNENIDRTIENMFIAIDRNRDGFIDFPEFVGAFRDVLRGDPSIQQDHFAQNVSYNMNNNEQYRPDSFGSNYPSQSMPFNQQQQQMSFNQQPQQMSFNQQPQQMSFNQQPQQLSFNQQSQQIPFNQQQGGQVYSVPYSGGQQGGQVYSVPYSGGQQGGQVISVPYSGGQQGSLGYNTSTNPIVISLDGNQSPYMINPQGQSSIGQPIQLQCVPLPMM